MKNKKNIIYILSVVIIVAGVICTAIWGFNYGTSYSEAERITIYLGKEYKMEDIKQIVNEVFEKEDKMYQEIEGFSDTVAVTVKNVTSGQLDVLNSKIKEKYELDDETVLTSSVIPHQRLRDIVKPYIMPLIITTIIVWLGMAVALKLGANEGIIAKLIMAFVNLVLAEAVYVSAFAITRLPINEFFIMGILSVYIIVTICSFKFKVNLVKEEKKK
ncbi:MAG: hypothetical protein HFJ45_10760 [Clostridia bacterium]|nr:hypothetical protein [Clostridia bacterium]